MDKQEVINQLEELQLHCTDMIGGADVWSKDVEALGIAIDFIKNSKEDEIYVFCVLT